MNESFTEFTNALAQNKSRIHTWRYEGGQLSETADLGTFYTQSVYLVLQVEFKLDSQPINTIYLWCGAFSDPDDEGPVNEMIQTLFSLLHSNGHIHHEYEGYECEHFLNAFIPYGGVRHRVPGLESVTSGGLSTLFGLKLKPVPHWTELPACVTSLASNDVNILKTRTAFNLWFGSDAPVEKKLRAAELCGSLRQNIGHDNVAGIIHQGENDKDFVRSLSSSPIEEPKRANIPPQASDVREVYQVTSSGDELEFQLVATKDDAKVDICGNDSAYILRDNVSIYVLFGKNQSFDGMGIGIVIAIMFMHKHNIPRSVHIQVVRSGDKFSDRW